MAFPVCMCQPHSSKSQAEFGVIQVLLSRINSLGCFVLPGANLSVEQCLEVWVGRLAVTFGWAGEGCGCLGVVSGQVPVTHLCHRARGALAAWACRGWGGCLHCSADTAAIGLH